MLYYVPRKTIALILHYILNKGYPKMSVGLIFNPDITHRNVATVSIRCESVEHTNVNATTVSYNVLCSSPTKPTRLVNIPLCVAWCG